MAMLLRCSNLKWLCLAFLVLGFTSVSGSESETLIMGTSNAPPYMIQETDSGLDIDIPRAVLKRMGYDLEVRYMPLARAQNELQNKRIDLMAPLFIEGVERVYMSSPHIYYRPTAFSLARRALSIQRLQDLGNYQIMTFQGAKGYFGTEFIESSQKSPRYSEISNMSLLPKSLYAERTDVVVIDYYIFLYFSNQITHADSAPELAIHDVFPRVPAAVAFHREKLRDEFNKNLKAIKHDGTYNKILLKYSR